MTASNTSHTSGRSSTGRWITKSSGWPPSGSSEVESLQLRGVAGEDLALAWVLALGCCVFFRGAFFRFRARDMTCPGASQVSGFLSAYPGHTMPAARHLMQTGCVPSHTRRRRRHSQQCSCASAGGNAETSGICRLFSPLGGCGMLSCQHEPDLGGCRLQQAVWWWISSGRKSPVGAVRRSGFGLHRPESLAKY